MLPPVKFLTFILMMWHIDANVIIYETGVDVGDNCFECGEQLVLSCQIDSYSISMSWQNDSSSIPFAQCLFDACTLDPDVANNFVFSTNTSTGTFNLTFTVSNYNNGTSYMCSDGTITETSLVLTKDYRPTFNNTIPGQLKAMSGCVNKDVIVQFIWKQENGGKCGKVEDVTQLEEEISCLLDTECGAADSIKHARTIEVEQGGASDQRLKVIVSYNGFRVDSFLTEERYICNGICVWDNNDYVNLVIMIVFLVIDFILYGLFCKSIFSKMSENIDWFRHTNTYCYSLWEAYILTICSWSPLLVTTIMSFLEFNPGPGAFDGKCKAWIIVGIIEIVWLIVHVVTGAFAIVKIRKERKGTGAVSFDLKTFLTDEKCVKSMYFINLPIVFVLLCFCIFQEDHDIPGNELESQSENETGSGSPHSTTQTDTNQIFTEEQHNDIEDVIDGKKRKSNNAARKKKKRMKQTENDTTRTSSEHVQQSLNNSTPPKKTKKKSSTTGKGNDVESNVQSDQLTYINITEKVSNGATSLNETNTKHVDVKPKQQLQPATDSTVNNGFSQLKRGISAVINTDDQYENTKC